MAVIVKHRRATQDEWIEHDPVIPDGELALTKRSTGYGIRVGDGVKRYSELTDLDGEIIIPEFNDEGIYEYDITLKKGDDVRLSCVEYLNLSFNGAFKPDFYAMISFDSDDPVTEISLPEGWVSFSGADVAGGVFTPVEYAHYTLFFWFDGALQCCVRAYYNE